MSNDRARPNEYLREQEDTKAQRCYSKFYFRQSFIIFYFTVIKTRFRRKDKEAKSTKGKCYVIFYFPFPFHTLKIEGWSNLDES